MMIRIGLALALLFAANPAFAASCDDLSGKSQSKVGKFAYAFCLAKTRDPGAVGNCNRLQVEALKFQCIAAAKESKSECRNIDSADPDGKKVCEVFGGSGSCSTVKDSEDRGWCVAFDEEKESGCTKLSSAGLADDCKELVTTILAMRAEKATASTGGTSSAPQVTVTDKDTAGAFVDGVMPRITEVVFGGGPALSGFGLPISPEVKVLPGAGVNAEQWVAEDETSNGVAVTEDFLAISNQNAVKFGILHEMGHLLTTKFNETLAMELSLYQQEIIADVAAAHLMQQDGSSWSDVENAVTTWRESKIFDEVSDGAHPPGDDRAAFVADFATRMQAGGEFMDVVRAMMASTSTYSP